MIHSYSCAETQSLFNSHMSQRFKSVERVARRKLLQLHAATELQILQVPPGNRLEMSIGDRKGCHSIRIDEQWRICFILKADGAYEAR